MHAFGIDVSEHNGTIDWRTASKHIDFAVLRLGWVSDHTHMPDQLFRKNYDACKKYGVKTGVYVYMYTTTPETAASGGKWASSMLQGLKLELPVYCDMEDDSLVRLGKTKISRIASAFCNEIEDAGRWAGIYANRNWYDHYLTAALARRYTTWIAHYTSGSTLYEGKYDMWQNSDTGRVKGVSGSVDTDYLYRDLFRAVAGSASKTRYYPKYTGDSGSIVDALKAVGADSAFAHRAQIAAANGIESYKGTPAQNRRLLALLKQGKLIQA